MKQVIVCQQKSLKKINPVLPGMYAADAVYDELSYHDDSIKFETGTIAYSFFDAWSAGLELLLDIGIENIYRKALEITGFLISGLREKVLLSNAHKKSTKENSNFSLY